MSNADQPNPHLNHLLAAVPPDEMEALRPELETVPLSFKQVLYEAERPLEHVYFPHRGVVSMVAEMEDGSAVEVATVGPEGIVGLPIFLGDTTVPAEASSRFPERPHGWTRRRSGGRLHAPPSCTCFCRAIP